MSTGLVWVRTRKKMKWASGEGVFSKGVLKTKRVRVRKKCKGGEEIEMQRERKRRFGVNAIISLIEAGLCACMLC